MNPEPITLEQLKAILRRRGFTVALGDDGRPVLRGKAKVATPALMRVVGFWREELIAELKGLKS